MVEKIKILDLFSGIGGFSLGMHRASERFETIAFAECDKFCQKVLKKNFPNIKIYDDVKDVQKIDCDLITAGFPCPAFSASGKRGGFEQDDLFYEVIRIAKINKPQIIILENVSGFAHKTRNWRSVLTNELKNIGYETQDFIFDARDFGVPQCRRRYFAICVQGRMLFSSQHLQRLQGKQGKNIQQVFSNNQNAQRRWTPTINTKEEWRAIFSQSFRRRNSNGISDRVDRLTSLGNAVVPKIITAIGKTIIKWQEKRLTT